MRLLKAALALAALTAAAFAADEYKIDPSRSSANFSVKNMGIKTVLGRFSQMSGVIVLDEAHPENSKVTADIKVSSISTDNDMRDKHLKSADFFDVAQYPDIKFESTKVEKRGSQWIAIGNLTMKDVTKQVELPFDLAKGQMDSREAVGITANTKLNRQDYHVSWSKTTEGVAMVSDDVSIELNIEAGKQAPAPVAASGK